MLGKVSYKDCSYVLYSLQMAHSSTDFAVIFSCSYGTHLLDHLAADGAGLTGGQVTVVAALQVNTNFLDRCAS